MNDVTNLNEQRALKAADNTKWTPHDCVTAFLRDMASGEIAPTKVIILYEEPESDGGSRISAYLANVRRDEEIALLELRKHAAMHRWLK